MEGAADARGPSSGAKRHQRSTRPVYGTTLWLLEAPVVLAALVVLALMTSQTRQNRTTFTQKSMT